MTATLHDLYDNIKELIHQKFETKTEEDTTLPEIVESYFNYSQGELDIDMPHMKLKVTGSSFATYSSTPFTYNGRIFVDWGDDSELVEYTGGKLSHSFTDGSNNHIIKIYGNITSFKINCFYYCIDLTSITIPNTVTKIGNNCFEKCTNLTSINIPNSITSLAYNCFDSCTGLTSINLNWVKDNILTYRSQWITNTSSNLKFSIPSGTTEYYVQAGYPSDKLVERD